jgi:DNA-binding NtrC family response regulator
MMADVVLVVEDETQVLILAESVLQQAGYETLSASSVAEALAIIDTDQRIGLLFTDLRLGEDSEGGLTIATSFANSRPRVPVLYATGRGVTDGMVALFVEPNGFLAKPYTVEQLETAVANLLGSNKEAAAPEE